MLNRTNIDLWEKWNNLIFREKKPAIVFTMYDKDKRKKHMIDRLRERSGSIPVILLEPKDFKKIFRDADEYMDPPVMIGFWGGECVAHFVDGDFDYPEDTITVLLRKVG